MYRDTHACRGHGRVKEGNVFDVAYGMVNVAPDKITSTYQCKVCMLYIPTHTHTQ